MNIMRAQHKETVYFYLYKFLGVVQLYLTGHTMYCKSPRTLRGQGVYGLCFGDSVHSPLDWH